MDYVPVNLAPQGTIQGDYFLPELGPMINGQLNMVINPLLVQLHRENGKGYKRLQNDQFNRN